MSSYFDRLETELEVVRFDAVGARLERQTNHKTAIRGREEINVGKRSTYSTNASDSYV